MQAALLERDGSGGLQEDVGCCRKRSRDRGGLAARVVVPRKRVSVFLDFYSCIALVAGLMWVPDTLLVLLGAVISVLLFDLELGSLAANLSWTAVSFMLMFPLQNAIKSAYQRREESVQALAELRALMLNLYVANAKWDWPGAEGFCGRGEDSKKKPRDVPLHGDHGERVRRLLLRVVDALQDLLLVPRSGRPRHEFSSWGRREKGQIQEAELQGRRQVVKLILRLHGATEDLKAAGMPANEASRINQYVMLMGQRFEKLWSYKTYRTPIALRAMMRVLIQVLPLFYGPYWVHIARGDDGVLDLQGSIFATFFASIISLITVAMINLERQIENPFDHYSLDTVQVKTEMDLCRTALDEAAEDLAAAWHERLDFEWELLERPGSPGRGP